MSDWAKVGGYVKKFAPILGTVLGGPAVGSGISLLASAFGVEDPDPTPDQLLAAIKADPEAAIKMRGIELTHKKDLADIVLQTEKEYLYDRQDARERDRDFQKAGKTNTRANWMIIGDVVGLILCMILLIVFQDKISGEVRGIVSTIAAYFGLGLRDAHQFEFGSSRGSKDKDGSNMNQLKSLINSVRGK